MDIRNKILSKVDFIKEPISIPEWDMDEGLFVRSMSGKERDEFEFLSKQIDSGKLQNINIRGRFASYCLVDENGKQIFKPEDMDKVAGKDGIVLDRIFTKIINVTFPSMKVTEEVF